MVKLGTTTTTALVDTGSDASFISPKFAMKANCTTMLAPIVKVTAANGKVLTSDIICNDCFYSIQGHQFISNFRLLEVQGYDIILGADWIYSHSPIALNLKTRKFSITKEGKEHVTFLDETLPDKHHPISANHLGKILKKKGAVGVVLVLNNDTLQGTPPAQPLLKEIQLLIQQYKDIFQEPTELPPQRSIVRTIPLMDNSKQVNQRVYRLPHHQKNAMEVLIEQLLKSEMIRPSFSPFSSPAILVKKKDGTWRMCVDYRQLNSNTIKNKYHIPIIKDLLDELIGAKVFSKIDLRSGYHQIRMQAADIHKTTFSTHLGHYEYLVMPFGLTNAPATFQALMNNILAAFLRKFALVFFDDILIYGATMSGHIHHLQEVFEALRTNTLFAKLSKCSFAQEQVEYLVISLVAVGLPQTHPKFKQYKTGPFLRMLLILEDFWDLLVITEDSLRAMGLSAGHYLTH